MKKIPVIDVQEGDTLEFTHPLNGEITTGTVIEIEKMINGCSVISKFTVRLPNNTIHHIQYRTIGTVWKFE
jgi:hypothetical protein